ncbi:hypothetical protein PSE_3356 [Pseudovibrio sp. FO-BEG1]|nr:hypothetical protein PSE_3356 [Pseudovibrio sp. FO-BEG1]
MKINARCAFAKPKDTSMKHPFLELTDSACSALVDACTDRDPKYIDDDLSCVKAIAQAAINVELFTIPLYMTALYSVQGTHQINSKGSKLYEGRWWPGSGPAADPDTTNKQVFNKVYSVFIEEMLHLQLASNMANLIGVKPCFTSRALQNEEFGWICYQHGNTMIPHILDFNDWIDHPILCSYDPDLMNLKGMQVILRAMNKDQAKLFMAIEETVELAKLNLENSEVPIPDPQPDGDKTRLKYFEPAPFDWFKASMTEADLPLFGSIGHMYLCYWSYLEITYSDGTSLLGRLLGLQRDRFNKPVQTASQYPMIDMNLEELDSLKLKLINNINAITDQGEGGDVVQDIVRVWGFKSWANSLARGSANPLGSVKEKFQPNKEALVQDYPHYDDQGKQLPTLSGIARARSDAADKDHFELFSEVLQLVQKPDYMTWDTWHEKHIWKPDMLGINGAPNVPCVEDIATALNNLKANPNSYQILSQAAVGTIKGITTVLNSYWNNSDNTEFPSPAMDGSGDRVSICWAVTGKVPDLVSGIASQKEHVLYHACQGMDLNGSDAETCASVLAYHSCKGSNECKTQGGCGFVQSASGGGSCGGSVAKGLKSAPADNKCGGFGGCAVPISASQLYPKQDDDCYEMQLYKFGPAPEHTSEPLKQHLPYSEGDAVYDIAWKAYCHAKGLDPDVHKAPKANDLRLAMPPST